MDDILAQHLEEKIILIFTQKEDPFPDLPYSSYVLHRGRLSSLSEEAKSSSTALLLCTGA